MVRRNWGDVKEGCAWLWLRSRNALRGHFNVRINGLKISLNRSNFEQGFWPLRGK